MYMSMGMCRIRSIGFGRGGLIFALRRILLGWECTLVCGWSGDQSILRVVVYHEVSIPSRLYLSEACGMVQRRMV